MSKPWEAHWFQRLAAMTALIAALAIAICYCGPASPTPRAPLPAATAAHRPVLAAAPSRVPVAPPPTPPPPLAETCDSGPAEAAAQNLSGLTTLVFAPFHRPETGWAIYEPLVVREIGATCGAGTPAFARDLAAWQGDHRLAASGVMDATTFAAMASIWLARRPFVAASKGGCPAPPDEASLAVAPADLSYGAKAMRLRPAALSAYEQMIAAARAESPPVRADPRLLTLFSAYRSPAEGAGRCLIFGDCQGLTRAACSAHQTGLAMDLYLGAAPGQRPDSSDDANRLAITQGGAYRWLAANAGRFGFVPYAFEPWHWEWTGEAS